MRDHRRTQSGLTLVELMVATTLSLILLSGVLLVFSANRTTYEMQTGLGTLQESGRYAIGQIVRDLQMAGFGGCLSPMVLAQANTTAYVLEVGAQDYVQEFADGEFIAAGDNVSGALSIYNDGVNLYYGADPDGDGAGAGTDWLEIRGPLAGQMSFVTGVTAGNTIELEGIDRGIETGDTVMVADCGGAEIFEVDGVSEDTGNDETDLSIGGSNAPANLSRVFGADSVVGQLVSFTYYVAATGRNDRAGRPVTALFRSDGVSSVEIVDGVEDLQVAYALDTNNNGVVDEFVAPGGIGTNDVIVGVRVALLMNSIDNASSVVAPYTYMPMGSTAVTPQTATDLRLRQEFSATVSVRNTVL